jgi:CRP/FNR family cyclic AMP-dependent transcriptional regulator
MSVPAPRTTPKFSAQIFLGSPGIGRVVREYGRGETVFQQGDACQEVHYIQSGGVQLSVLSKSGSTVPVATLGPGDFFGEGCLSGQRIRNGSATAVTPCVIVSVHKSKMAHLLQDQHAMSDRFISQLLSRNVRIEEDLVEQLLRVRKLTYQQNSA